LDGWTIRCQHEPIAHITGTRDFWTITLGVSPAVLIPRPDSETLIEAAVTHFGAQGPRHVLDLGTGSGALLLAALSEWPAASGVGVDVSEDALAVAAANAQRLGLNADFRLGNWAEAISETFDLILCNPPYVESGAQLVPEVVDYEPAAALFAGDDGLDDYRRLMPQFERLMAPGAIVALEIGADQAAAVSTLALEVGLRARCFQDLGGRNRCLLLERLGHQID
jgi:release factor glutamine methyltransferase